MNDDENKTKEQLIEELLRTRRQQDLLLNSAMEGIFGLDINGNHSFVNPAAARMLGYEIGELVGQASHATWHHSKPDGSPYPEEECPIYQSLKHGVQQHVRNEVFWKKNGSNFQVAYNSTPIMENDTIIGAVVTFWDISERQQADNLLQESEYRYRRLFETAQDGILLVDATTGAITDVNPFIMDLLGYAKEELVGKYLWEVGAFQDVIESKKKFTELQKEKYVRYEGLPLETKAGKTIEVEFISNVYTVNHEEVIQCNIRDITTRNQEGRARVKLEGQLAQAQKMEAIGTLAGGIAHDFNNILGIIFGYTEMALLGITEETPLKQHLEQILKAGYRAKDLVKQILTFSRQVEQERKPLQINPVVKESLKMLRSALPTTIEIRTDVQSMSMVQADPTQIHQILMNLCTNAAHAMREEGGVLGVNLHDIDFDVQVPRPDISPGPYIKLSISDTGHGMTPGVVKRIFEPFFTTKIAGEGTGLGLSVVYGIVKSYQGSITVYSEPGQGTTFNVFLPRLEVQPTAESQLLVKPPTGEEQILLVDDEPVLLDLGQQMLEYLGYQVESRTSSIEALKAFEAQPDRFDLVITDQTMPHLTGVKLAKELMRLRPSLPIILCTGFSELVTPEKAQEMGIKAMLMKPLVLNDLAKIVRSVLDAE